MVISPCAVIRQLSESARMQPGRAGAVASDDVVLQRVVLEAQRFALVIHQLQSQLALAKGNERQLGFPATALKLTIPP
jgi:hypothetical protein